jgi:hypothetical protein
MREDAMAQKIPLPVPAPAVQLIKLKVKQDLRLGNAVYTAGHEIEVFYHEAVKLLTDYPACFEVLS